MKGDGNSYMTEFRQYDPRLGRWLSLDPLMMMFPEMSPYVGFDNNPIFNVDPLGLAAYGWGGKDKEGGGTTWTYDASITTEAQAKAAGYDSYMDEGVIVGATIGNGPVGSVRAEAGGAVYYIEDVGGGITLNENAGINSTPTEEVNNAESSKSSENGSWDIDINRLDMTTSGNGQSAFFDDIAHHPEWAKNRANMAALNKGAMYYLGGSLAAPFIIAGGITYAGYVGGSLAGEYGVTAQVAAWYRVGNTTADAVSQTIDISVNGGSWNWGSTVGNFTLNNPFLSAAPGTLYTMANDKNIKQNIGAHLGNYGLAVMGNYVSGKVGTINSQYMSGGMKHGLSSSTLPLMINSFTTSGPIPTQ